MRKLFSFVSTTLDGYHEGPDREFDFWTVDEAFLAFSVNQLRDVGVLLLGRTTYEGFAAFWPSAEAAEVSPDVAELMNAVPKVVFSTTLTAPTWHNTTVVAEDVAGRITALKQEPGRDLAVFGSSRLTTSLLAQGLVDEVRVMVNPTLIGAGPSLFAGLPDRVALELLSATTYRSGNVLLCYRCTPA